jgi:hypothetical protein
MFIKHLLDIKRNGMETDNPRDVFPTGKNPDCGGSKKRYPPHGKA